ncbi:MAG: hypothetical protein ACMUIM_12500 [bacterium]
MEKYFEWFEKNTKAILDKNDKDTITRLGESMKKIGMLFKETGLGTYKGGNDCGSESGGGSCDSHSCLANGGGGDCDSDSCFHSGGGGDCGNDSCGNESGGGSCGNNVCSSCSTNV